MLKKMNNMKIEKRLTFAFVLVALIATIAAVVGCVAMVYTSDRYAYALKNYGFSQGDVGKALVTFADSRSSTRAIISYTDSEIIEENLTVHDEKKQTFQEYMTAIEKTLTAPAEVAAYEEATTALESYWAADAEIIELGNTTDTTKSQQAQAKAADELDPLYDQVYDALATLMTLNVNTGNELDSSLSTIRTVLIVVILVVIVLAMTVSVLLGRSIARGIAIPVGALAKRLNTFAQGNLQDPFPQVDSNDEVGDMISAAASMAENLRIVIQDLGYGLEEIAKGNYTVESTAPDLYLGEFIAMRDALANVITEMHDTLLNINQASDQVALGSGQLAEGAQSLAEGATDQAASVEELQATIDSVGSIIDENTKEIQSAYDRTKAVSTEADNSKEEMKTMVESMEKINATSVQIGDIIAQIEDIASQTNLLSLNASIEAARAGEAGKGFAVVADQIGKLAEESAQSAVNTKELIEQSLAEVNQGNEITERTQAALERVILGVQEFTDVFKSIAQSSEEQSQAVKQIENGIDQISKVVQNNSAAAEETSATSEELSAQSASLKEMINQFQL